MDLEQFKQRLFSGAFHIFDYAHYKNGALSYRSFLPCAPSHAQYSVSKTYTATAMGMLQDDKKLDLDDKALGFLRQYLPKGYAADWENVTIKHLLTHSHGHAEGFMFEHDRYGSPDKNWAQFILSRPLDFAPGTKMCYSNAPYYLLSLIAENAAGMPLYTFLKRRLFDPLDFMFTAAESCPYDHTFGASGFFIRTLDMAKLGILYLNGGVYEGKRYLSQEFVRAATGEQIVADKEKSRFYGLSFWRKAKDSCYMANGAYGQLILICPEQNEVLAVNSFDHGYCINELMYDVNNAK